MWGSPSFSFSVVMSMRLLLYGGGVDSLCCAVLIKPDALLWVNYGQPSWRFELKSVRLQSVYLALPLFTERIRLPFFIVDDYIVNRNLALTLAGVGVALRNGFDEIVFAFTRPSNYPDTTAAWTKLVDRLINIEVPIKVSAPLAGKTKVSVVRAALAIDPNLPFHLTISCMQPTPCRYPNFCPKCASVAKVLKKVGFDLQSWQAWLK